MPKLSLPDGIARQSGLACDTKQPGGASITLQSSGQRRDIDGLRALAVMPVVLYHFKTGPFMGGFLGVDVFFVISGYLITGIVVRELAAGTFSFAAFYERRARRILPALLVMIAAVLAASAWLHFPSDFAGVPPSALAALGFLANLWFWSKTGYFASDADTMPLLHTWSLGIEEQFYLAMPLALWALARSGPRWRTGLLALGALASFAACVWLGARDPDAAFYLPQTRAWELLAGALLACRAMPPVKPGALREALALFGLALIAIAVIWRAPPSVLPAFWILIAVLGTALLLSCAPATVVGRILSLPPLVGIGLISYSLYLWHWPLIAFAAYVHETPLPRAMRLGLLVASLLIAWASWRWIEQPFRNPARMPRRRAMALGGAIGLAAALAAVCLLPLGGWPTRFPASVAQIAAYAQASDPLMDPCLAGSQRDVPQGCRFGGPAAPTIVVWGDSHSTMLARAIGEARAREGESVVLHARSGCPPLPFMPSPEGVCRQFNARIMAQIRQRPDIRRVYLSANWSRGYGEDAMLAEQIGQTISALRATGKDVVVIGQVPLQRFDVPRHLMRLVLQGSLTGAHGISTAEHARQTAWVAASYPRWRAMGATIIDPVRGLADGDHTRIADNGKALYVDKHHLTMAGARAVIAANPGR